MPENEAREPLAPTGFLGGFDSINLYTAWRSLVRRRWLVIPFFLATVLVASVLTVRQTRFYEATCAIIIDLTAPRFLEKDQVQEVVETGASNYWSGREYSETQFRIIASRAVAQRVAQRLQLQQNDKFMNLDRIGDPTLREAKRKARDPVTILQRNLRIEPVKESRVVRLRFRDRDPELAAMIANAFAEAYIAESQAQRSSTTQNASEWLENQLADLERKLDESGKALFDFKRAHDIVATSWEDRQSMVSQRLTAVNEALTRAQVKRAELDAHNQAIQELAAAVANDSPANALPAMAGATTQVIENLKLRYLDASSECAELQAKYLPDHPKVETCAQKLAATRSALEAEVRHSLDNARREYQEVVQTEKNLRRLLEESKSEAFGLNQHERDYLELKRTYDNNQRLYELVLKRLKDTGVTSMLQVSNVRVLDRARPNFSPVRPNVPQNIIAAVFLGLLGGLALALGAEFLDTSITAQDQVEEKLRLTFLGIVPRIPPSKDGTSQDLYVAAEPKSAVAECLAAVRTNVLFMFPEKPPKTILVTSAGPQEGKTTTATSLAITMAASGNRVLIVDGDLRRPRLHRVFRTSNVIGLSSLILGEGSLETAVQPTEIPNLSLLPSGPVPPNPAELLHTGALKRLLKQMGERFDRVIIDSAPVGVVSDSLVMATNVDGTLMVLRTGKTSRDVAIRSVRQLRDLKAVIIGAVLNDLDLEDRRYSYYSYYYRYGYYGDGRSDTPEATPGRIKTA
jgi:polysaccharide biosynthesis transport protein